MRSVVVLPQPDGPEQREELAGREFEREVVDRDHALELLGDVLQTDRGRCLLRALGRSTALSVVVNDRSFPRYCFEPYRHPHEISCQAETLVTDRRADDTSQLNLTTRCCASRA